mgnify:CR=1 FL=1
MALTGKKYSPVHDKTGADKDKLKDKYDEGHINTIVDFKEEYPHLTALVYQIQEMQDELDYLRTEISANKNKATFPGLGTSSTTALAGDTKLVGIGSNTTLSFGDLTETKTGKGTTYTIVLQATRNFGGKTGLITKSATITLT